MNELANVPASIFALLNYPFWAIVIKSTIAIALAALACRLLHRQSAALGHRIWVVGHFEILLGIPSISQLHSPACSRCTLPW